MKPKAGWIPRSGYTTGIAIAPQPIAPSTSWWITPRSRAEFQTAAKAQVARMAASRMAAYVTPSVRIVE